MQYQDRWYQAEAVDATAEFMRDGGTSGLISIPTGGGKSVVIGKIVSRAARKRMRCLVALHRKELGIQDRNAIINIDPTLRVGLNSAGLRQRDFQGDCVVCSIQSVWMHAEKFGHIDMLFIDECHLVSRDPSVKMYFTFINELRKINPRMLVIGMTATPFRLGEGHLCAIDSEGRPPIFDQVIYRVGIKPLIRDGFLCPIVTKAGSKIMRRADSTKLQGGEFKVGVMDKLASEEEVIEVAVREFLDRAGDRQHVITFVPGVGAGVAFTQALNDAGVQSEFVCGDTSIVSDAQRDDIFRRHKSGELRNVVNVGVATTGYDNPMIDAILDVSPTMSPTLHAQKIGRGFRIHPSKTDCILVDVALNSLRHGGVDHLDDRFAEIKAVKKGKPQKEPSPNRVCEKCFTVYPKTMSHCPDCKTAYTPSTGFNPEKYSKAGAADNDVIDGMPQPMPNEEVRKVLDIDYSVHEKPAHNSLRLIYHTNKGSVSRWMCFSHPVGTWPRTQAVQWWARHAPRGVPAPMTSERALEIIKQLGPNFSKADEIITKVGSSGYPTVTAEWVAPKDKAA